MKWTVRAVTRLMDLAGVPDEASGDLLERHHHGQSTAWLIGQAVAISVMTQFSARRHTGHVLMWAAIVFVTMGGRTVWDALAPPADYGLRSAVTTYVAIATYVAAGMLGGYRTGRVRSGIWFALSSHLIGHLWTAVLTLALALGMPGYEQELAFSGGASEVWQLPLLMIPAVAVLGAAGAAIGRLLRRSAPTPA